MEESTETIEVTPETPVVEVTPPVVVAPPAPPKEEPKLGKQFAALSRKENELRSEREAFKAEQEKFKNEQTQASKIFQAVANAKDNPLALLEVAGLDFEKVARHVIADGKPDPMQKIDELNQKLEAEKTARETAEAERLKREDEANQQYVSKLIEGYKAEVNTFLKANPDKYESILAYDAGDAVWLKIYETFSTTGEVMSPEAAADAVESEIEENLVNRALSLKKVQARLKPPEVEAPKTESNGHKTRPAPRTLSVKQVTTNGAQPPASSLAKDERLKRAMAKLVYTDK